MTFSEAVASFHSSLAAGETRSQAHETVAHELNELLAELADADLPTEGIEAVCREWAETDPRTLAVAS